MIDNQAEMELAGLHQPIGGLFSTISSCSTNNDELRVRVRNVDLGNVGAVWPEVGKRGGPTATIKAGGAGLTDGEALVPALAEGLERYSAAVFREEQFVWATAKELDSEALDLDLLPRCSDTERSHPKCPLVLPDKTKRIRWIRGLSILDGRQAFIPAVLVYSHIGYAVPEERFWLPISTGCAAHTSYERALLAALYEVVERDALTITWLQRLQLPRIGVDCVSPPLAQYWQRYLDASADLTCLFFDATTDLGVPTVYALQRTPHNGRVATLVACAAGATITEAICKVILDMAALRLVFRTPRRIPDSWDDFTDLLDGATLLARPESAAAFEFLTTSATVRRLSEIRDDHKTNALLQLLFALRQLGLSAFAVDLTTDEGIRAGMRVIRAIIPGLQPLSFRYRARFLGHSRLYSAPIAMGHRSLTEDELNPWPQPFA